MHTRFRNSARNGFSRRPRLPWGRWQESSPHAFRTTFAPDPHLLDGDWAVVWTGVQGRLRQLRYAPNSLLAYRQILRQFRRHVNDLIPDCPPAAVTALRNHMNIRELQEVLGHKSVVSTLNYQRYVAADGITSPGDRLRPNVWTDWPTAAPATSPIATTGP